MVQHVADSSTPELTRGQAISAALADLSADRGIVGLSYGLATLSAAGVAWSTDAAEEDTPAEFRVMTAREWGEHLNAADDPYAAGWVDADAEEDAPAVDIDLGASGLIAVTGPMEVLRKSYPGDVATWIEGETATYVIDAGEDAAAVLSDAGTLTRRGSRGETYRAGDHTITIPDDGRPIGPVPDATTAVGASVVRFMVQAAGQVADAADAAALARANKEDRDAAPGDPHARAVQKEADRLDIQEEGRREQRRRRDARRGLEREPVEAVTLVDLLAEDDSPVSWLVDGLWSADGLCLLYAPAKVGKSRAAHGVVEALAAGELLWDRFATNMPAGNIGLIDLELSRDMLRTRLRSLDRMGRGHDRHEVVTWSLRHDRRQFDVSDDDNMSLWATRLRDAGVTVLVLDCLSPVMRAAGMDEWTQGGEVLGTIRQLAADAGVQAVMIVDHASGKLAAKGNGPRGDSRKMDEPDQVWHLSPDTDNDPHAPSPDDRFWMEVTNRAGAPATVCLATDGVRFTRAPEQDAGDRLHSLAYRVYPAMASTAENLRTEWELSHGDPAPDACWPPVYELADRTRVPGVGRRDMRAAADYLVRTGCLVETGVKRPRGKATTVRPDHRPDAVPTGPVVALSDRNDDVEAPADVTVDGD